jgi:hypothetical protein
VYRADLPPSVLWRNRQTEACLVLRPKPRNRRGDFEAQITKLELPVLRPKPGNPPPPWFWGSTKKPTTDFEAKPGETVATSFEAKLEKTVTTGFEAKTEKTVAAGFDAKLQETVAAVSEAKPLEIVTTDFEAKPSESVATSFEAKPVKTVRVVLRPNHSQTIDLGFDAQPRNPRSSSPHARCRPHTASPDLSITRPSSTRPARPSSILCSRSPTPAMILIAARHAAPATYTPWDKQTRFSEWNKDKRKTKWNYPGFKFKPRQVNDSSQSNQGTDHLVSQSPPWWVHWQQKHKVWSSNPRPHEARLEDQKARKSSRRSSRRRKTAKANKGHEKRQSQAKW